MTIPVRPKCLDGGDKDVTMRTGERPRHTVGVEQAIHKGLRGWM